MSFALFYNTNPSYLYATIQSIKSLRNFFPVNEIKPYVAVMHSADFDISTLSSISENLGIEFISINESIIDVRLKEKWMGGRIPPVTLLKFSVFDLLPDKIDRVLYIDPDTLFVKNPRKLFEFQPFDGYIGAVEDALTFYVDDWSDNGVTTRAYVRSLGLSVKDGYFNAGLLLFDRRTWVDVSADCLEYLSSNMEKCLYLDQSALNSVASQRKVPLSPVWNYQTRFRFWEDAPCLEPNILHFTGAGKPWLGRMEPWCEIHDRLLLMEGDIEAFGIKRPHINPEKVFLHNHDFTGITHRIRRKVDYRLALRRRKLKKLHDDADC